MKQLEKNKPSQIWPKGIDVVRWFFRCIQINVYHNSVMDTHGRYRSQVTNESAKCLDVCIV